MHHNVNNPFPHKTIIHANVLYLLLVSHKQTLTLRIQFEAFNPLSSKPFNSLNFFMSIISFNISHSCLLPSPSSLFHNTKSKHYFLTIPSSKPFTLKQLSSINNPKTHRFTFTSFVAQTSDWAQQEDSNTATFEDQEDSQTEAAGLSEWETNAEDAEGEGGEFEDGSFVEPPEEAKLFVGNLPYDIDSQKLAMLFEDAGTVEVAEVIFNRDTNQSRGFGFVTMSTVEEAENAVEKFNRYGLDGRLLTVNKASPRGSRAERPPSNFENALKVYVGNLPWDVDNNRLEQIFSEHGKVESARVVFDRETGRSRGFGFVTFSDETEMNDAIAALDGQSLDGRAIRVNVAEDRPRRSSF
ncbi:hypothetical protein Lal_00031827 [Lupinus albus]|uniref:Putative RNA recognition motif domain-containing protein n=1 Tax=Lupinus albus TaxID=3870 RepID=A0A6A4NJD3_LUPAL|nr:putative RNA recognition motif domain-containing protein [Lupinus albus]KAF1864864.1 hypothetical protein Lal_00031827 [Lupinus albus]